LGALATRISESVDLALRLGEGMLLVESQTGSEKKETLMSEKFACPDCGISYPAPEPRTFSFNSPMGACPKCDGLGIDPDLEEEAQEVAEEALQSGNDLFVPEQVTPESAPCKECKGTRLRKESLHYKLADRNIA